MKKRTTKSSLLLLISLFLCRLLFAQCNVTSITFHTEGGCNQQLGVHTIPVSVSYTGSPFSVKFETQNTFYKMNPQQYANGSGSFTTTLYSQLDGLQKTISVTVTLQNGNCANQTLTVTHTFISPTNCANSTCPAEINLNGLLSGQTIIYTSKDSISSSQVISNSDVEMHAKVVRLLPGFHYIPSTGNELRIDTQNCNN